MKELLVVKENLSSRIDELQKEVHCLKIKRDIYEKAAETIKKDQGINIQILNNHEKSILINALRKNLSVEGSPGSNEYDQMQQLLLSHSR